MSFTGLLGDWLRKINNSITSLSINGPTVTYNKHDGTEGTETINLDSIYAKLTGTLVDNIVTRTSPSGRTAQLISHGTGNTNDYEIMDVGWNFANRDGAVLGLRSSSHPIQAGQFQLNASNGTDSAVLVGKPDGSLSWNGKSLINNGEFNKMFFSQTSGSYTAPYTGVFKITLKGGGGAGAYRNIGQNSTGGGGGEGATAIFYTTLTKNTSYAYTIGAGAQSGYAVEDAQGAVSYVEPTGSGNTSISINNSLYAAGGGGNAWTGGATPQGGQGGSAFALPGVTGERIYGAPGNAGLYLPVGAGYNIPGASGGGNGGARGYAAGGATLNGQFGGGGAGMAYRNTQQSIDFYRGGNGGDGYILIEYAG